MWMFLGVLFFFAAGILSIMAIVNLVKKHKMKALKLWVASSVCFFIFVAAAINDPGSEPADSANAAEPPAAVEQEKEPEPEPSAPPTIEEQVAAAIVKGVGEKTNMKKDRTVSVRFVDDVLAGREGAKIAEIVLNGDENITDNMTKSGMLFDSKRVFEPLFALQDISEVSLSWQLGLVDAYGNASDGVVLRIRLKEGTADKINWKNFSADNYSKIADQYWEHPLFKK